MFSIFSKKKTILKDLIPTDYIDIHSHFLPGIDDGASNIATTEELLLAVQRLGFTQVITTPHTIAGVWPNTTASINNTLAKTQTELPELSHKLQLRAASEYFLDEEFSTHLSSGELLTLKENYVLVEMSYLSPPIQLFDWLFDLQVAGYKPVLAHPERYNFYHTQPEMYDRLKKAGCLFQLNWLSVTGYYGKKVAEVSEMLLTKKLYDFVGSDIHHGKHISAFENPVVIKNIHEITTIAKNNTFFKIGSQQSAVSSQL